MISRVIYIFLAIVLVSPQKLAQKNGYIKMCNYMLMPVREKHVIYLPVKTRPNHLAQIRSNLQLKLVRKPIVRIIRIPGRTRPVIRIIRKPTFRLVSRPTARPTRRLVFGQIRPHDRIIRRYFRVFRRTGHRLRRSNHGFIRRILRKIRRHIGRRVRHHHRIISYHFRIIRRPGHRIRRSNYGVIRHILRIIRRIRPHYRFTSYHHRTIRTPSHMMIRSGITRFIQMMRSKGFRVRRGFRVVKVCRLKLIPALAFTRVI